ncbi:MAG: hypothetical protein A2Y33_07225 [Spirochaetes bacterium GWF1_51_8]|nr:MAG: hypothetical protein A2Y33_07225 [Spirochaetes bacterium GWF1_51_8]
MINYTPFLQNEFPDDCADLIFTNPKINFDKVKGSLHVNLRSVDIIDFQNATLKMIEIKKMSLWYSNKLKEFQGDKNRTEEFIENELRLKISESLLILYKFDYQLMRNITKVVYYIYFCGSISQDLKGFDHIRKKLLSSFVEICDVQFIIDKTLID